MTDQLQAKEAEAEEVQLNLLQGSGEEQNSRNHAISGGGAASCCPDSTYRKLAIFSIICGLSCIGVKALIYSVKVLSAVCTCTNTAHRQQETICHAPFDAFYMFSCLVLDSTG